MSCHLRVTPRRTQGEEEHGPDEHGDDRYPKLGAHLAERVPDVDQRLSDDGKDGQCQEQAEAVDVA